MSCIPAELLEIFRHDNDIGEATRGRFCVRSRVGRLSLEHVSIAVRESAFASETTLHSEKFRKSSKKVVNLRSASWRIST